MGEKQRMILQSCKADVRVKRREGGETEIKVLRYKSLVHCLSVYEGGNVSESESKNFTILNWEGYVQEKYVNRLLSITTSDGDKHTFKLKEAVPAAVANDLFWYTVERLNESDNLVGLIRNVDVELMWIALAEAAPVNKVPVANYDSGKKTITYSKDELGSERINYLADMVGHTIGLHFHDTSGPLNLILGDVDAKLWDYGYDWFYATVASVSVEGDDVIVGLTTDIKTKGKFAKEKVEALNNVNSGEYYVGALNAFPGEYVQLSVDIDQVIALDNGKFRVEFKAREARAVYLDAATETMGSVLSNQYIEKMIKEGEDNPKCKMKLHVKTNSGARLVIAMENVEKIRFGLLGWVWAGEVLLPDTFSSDYIDSAAFLSSAASGTPLVIM